MQVRDIGAAVDSTPTYCVIDTDCVKGVTAATTVTIPSAISTKATTAWFPMLLHVLPPLTNNVVLHDIYISSYQVLLM